MRRKTRRFGALAGIVAASVIATIGAGGAFPLVSGADPARSGPAIAAPNCPPFSFTTGINLAKNASFETVGPNGSPTTWMDGDPVPPPSAAKGWIVHTSNDADTVTSELVPTQVPGPGGSRMLHFIAGGNEGGVLQAVPGAPLKMMFSVWVKVRSGHVAVQATAGTSGPDAWSTKIGEWEQLRVCTDGTVPVDTLVIVNEDPAGGDFFVDRVEFLETP